MEFFTIIEDYLIIIPLISLLISIVLIVSSWKLFDDAGELGWKSVVPIYSLVTWLRIAKLPLWFLAFLGLPVISIAINSIILLTISYTVLTAIYIYFILKIAKIFNQKDEYIVGLIVLPYVFFPIMAFLPNKNTNESTQENTSIPSPIINPIIPVVNAEPAVTTQPSIVLPQPTIEVDPPIEINNVVEQPIITEPNVELSAVSSLPTEVLDSAQEINIVEEISMEPIIETSPAIIEPEQPIINMEPTTIESPSIIQTETLIPAETVQEQPIINIEEKPQEAIPPVETSPKLIKFCAKCGSQLIDNTSYCINCGVKL